MKGNTRRPWLVRRLADGAVERGNMEAWSAFEHLLFESKFVVAANADNNVISVFAQHGAAESLIIITFLGALD